MDHDSRWLPGLDAPPARPQGTISSEHARDAGDACALSRAGCRGHAYALPHLRRRRRARTDQHRYPRRAQGRRAVAHGRSAEHGFAPGSEALSGVILPRSPLNTGTSMAGVAGQGVGARVRRKEDSRFLRGRGNYVSDMVLPGQSEVAFLRSPVAHARIRRIAKPPGSEGRAFIRSDLKEAAAMIAPTTVPGYKLSEWHPLAHDKVRFVGEAVAMCVAPTRAEAEDLTEEIEVEFDELPVLVDALAARAAENVRVHEQWNDNSFLTLNLDNRYEGNTEWAPVVAKAEVPLNRHAKLPM